MIGISFYIYLLPKSINKPKGRIADAYKKREQELKEISEMNDISCKNSPIVNEDEKVEIADPSTKEHSEVKN